MNPNSPTFPGVNKKEMYAAKFGAQRTEAIIARLSSVGENEGIKFSFGGNSGRTRDSHRVIWYAGNASNAVTKAGGDSEEGFGIQSAVVQNLFRAYFEEEKNITDPVVLKDAATAAGLDGGEIDALLESDRGGEEVDVEAGDAARKLVSGVPFFEIQGKYVIEGADEPEAFLEVFEKVKNGE